MREAFGRNQMVTEFLTATGNEAFTGADLRAATGLPRDWLPSVLGTLRRHRWIRPARTAPYETDCWVITAHARDILSRY